jgi:hypothetical protein
MQLAVLLIVIAASLAACGATANDADHRFSR